MKTNQISKDLMAGARFLERYGFPTHDRHPLRALAQSLQRKPDAFGYCAWKSPEHKNRYYNAAYHLHEVVGFDNADLSLEEAIDVLVAGACLD